jgi:hypothetical protein
MYTVAVGRIPGKPQVGLCSAPIVSVVAKGARPWQRREDLPFTVMWYNLHMTPKLKEVLARAKPWPKTVQDEALQLLLIIEARHARPYRLSADEFEDMQESLGQADRGEFVPEEIVEAWDKRHGI